MVRYFGCGKNRVNVEPPVTKGVTENCMQSGDPEIKSFMCLGLLIGSVRWFINIYSL